MIRDIQQRRRQFAPNSDALRKSLPDVGASLDTACCELARDCSLPRIDALAARVKAAEQTIALLRRAVVAESGD